MRDTRALKNLRNLTSWRAWQGEALKRSGFNALTVALTVVMIPLVVLFSFAITRLKAPLTSLEVLAGLYLLTVAGWMVFALLRLNAWMRIHPWTPPSERCS